MKLSAFAPLVLLAVASQAFSMTSTYTIDPQKSYIKYAAYANGVTSTDTTTYEQIPLNGTLTMIPDPPFGQFGCFNVNLQMTNYSVSAESSRQEEPSKSAIFLTFKGSIPIFNMDNTPKQLIGDMSLFSVDLGFKNDVILQVDPKEYYCDVDACKITASYDADRSGSSKVAALSDNANAKVTVHIEGNSTSPLVPCK